MDLDIRPLAGKFSLRMPYGSASVSQAVSTPVRISVTAQRGMIADALSAVQTSGDFAVGTAGGPPWPVEGHSCNRRGDDWKGRGSVFGLRGDRKGRGMKRWRHRGCTACRSVRKLRAGRCRGGCG